MLNFIDTHNFTEFNKHLSLTKSDLNQIRTIVSEEIDGKTDDKLTQLKSDIFEKIDPILREVVAAREEQPLIENRLEALEEIHKDGLHSLSQ